MRSPRRVTLAPIALPSRSLKPAIDFLARVTIGFWPVILVRSRDGALEQGGLGGGGADAHVDDDLLEPRNLHHVVDAELVLELVADVVVVAGLGAARAFAVVGASHDLLSALLADADLRAVAVDLVADPGRAALGAQERQVGDRCGMSLSMIPPCMVARVGRWLLRATLTPSTITLPSRGRARMTLPSLPRSLPVRTRTRSPLRIFRPAITGPRVPARRSS